MIQASPASNSTNLTSSAADVYGGGLSEEVVGSWLQKQNREALVIATKVRFPMGSGPNDGGLSRKHILAGVEESLKRLQTSYIDLLQVHWSVDLTVPPCADPQSAGMKEHLWKKPSVRCSTSLILARLFDSS